MWLQLAIKALVSGALIAAASELARRNPAWGGLVASLPLTSLLAMIWLWRGGGSATQIADFAVSSTAYVIASLPAFVLIALLLRRGQPFVVALAAGVMIGFAGYLLLGWAGRRWGLPV